MVMTKRLINKIYLHIMSIRCITYHINLLINDIMKHKFLKLIILQCIKIVNYFHKSYKAGALLSEDIKNNLIKRGGLKGYCKTCWSMAFNYLISILRCKRSLHNILETQSNVFSSEIKNLLQKHIFFQDVKKLIKIIKPIKEVLTSLKYKMIILLDCFIQLMKLEIMIQIPNILNQEFRSYCLKKFNLR